MRTFITHEIILTRFQMCLTKRFELFSYISRTTDIIYISSALEISLSRLKNRFQEYKSSDSSIENVSRGLSAGESYRKRISEIPNHSTFSRSHLQLFTLNLLIENNASFFCWIFIYT